MTNSAGYFSLCLLDICILSLEKWRFKFFAYIKCLFIVELQTFFICSRYKSFIRDMICKSFLAFGGLSFHLIGFWQPTSFCFWWSPVYPFGSFVACAFGIISKKSLSNLRLQRFTPMFSSTNFYSFSSYI